MRILHLAPLWETVPPPAYGGTEAVASVLVEELARQGHDVTLCASGDSTTSAQLYAVYDRSLRTAHDLTDRSPYDWTHVALSLKEGKGYDLIHNHAGELAMSMSHLVDVPMLTTMHCQITPDTAFVWNHYGGWYNTISHAQRAIMPPIAGGTFAGVVHNAIDVESFPFCEKKGDYLLFLSRVSPEKGTHLAVDVARRLDMRLIIAGKVDRVDQDYFDQVVKPLIDGKHVCFAGEADATLKRELYAKALCLVLPLRWDEPFGLVMAEAMACGTPVVAFRRGAAPEVIADGRTGYLVADVEGMADAIRNIDRIQPAACRRHVEEHFAPHVMGGRYLAMYEAILGAPRAAEVEEVRSRPLPVRHDAVEAAAS